MIISHGRHYIFVHIPKTGGTALSMALETRAMKDDILIGDTPKAVKRRRRVKGLKGSGRLWKHSGLADIHGLISDADMESFFVLTLVRNPWDRMVSYYHWLREQGWDHPAVKLAKSLKFCEFLAEEETKAAIGGGDFASYVTDQTGVERCDLFARIENITDDLAPFRAHLGFDLGAIERSNSSHRGRDYRPYYSDKEAALVGRLCATDIARFGYTF